MPKEKKWILCWKPICVPAASKMFKGITYEPALMSKAEAKNLCKQESDKFSHHIYWIEEKGEINEKE